MTDKSITLMASLRDATLERHARMEKLPFITALTSGTLPLQSYVGQLRTMAVIHSTFEHELRLAELTDFTSLYLAMPSRLAHLRADLSFFDQLYIPDCLNALEHAREIAEQIRLYRLEQPVALLGILYVLEGTTLGNAVHLPDVVNTFGSQVSGGTHFYAGYGDKTNLYWQEFRSAMNSLTLDDDCHDKLITVAHKLFDQLEELFVSLHPIRESGLGFTAGMLNPDAGHHAVTNCLTEIQAATVAAKKCCDEFPYFDLRYGDRGKGFARSDAAWLVTLAELPGSVKTDQIEWLGRVLGNRGMPRITIERQLELLYEELVKANQSQTARYEELHHAANHLKLQRQEKISGERFIALTQQFHDATDGEAQGRLRNTGKLIVSAVCDQAAGISEAVYSLQTWLTDPIRFDSQWISAVNRTIEQATCELR